MEFLIEYSGGELNRSNHNNDNSFFLCEDKNEFEKWLEKYNCIFLGLTQHFNFGNCEEDELAFVYMDSEGEIWWTHFPVMSLHRLANNGLSFEERNAKVKEFLNSINYKLKNKLSILYFE